MERKRSCGLHVNFFPMVGIFDDNWSTCFLQFAVSLRRQSIKRYASLETDESSIPFFSTEEGEVNLKLWGIDFVSLGFSLTWDQVKGFSKTTLNKRKPNLILYRQHDLMTKGEEFAFSSLRIDLASYYFTNGIDQETNYVIQKERTSEWNWCQVG